MFFIFVNNLQGSFTLQVTSWLYNRLYIVVMKGIYLFLAFTPILERWYYVYGFHVTNLYQISIQFVMTVS